MKPQRFPFVGLLILISLLFSAFAAPVGAMSSVDTITGTVPAHLPGITTQAAATTQAGAGSLRGHVAVEGGASAEGLVVSVSLGGKVAGMARVDADGRYMLGNLSDGHYTVAVLGQDGHVLTLASKSVVAVGAGQDVSADLRVAQQPVVNPEIEGVAALPLAAPAAESCVVPQEGTGSISGRITAGTATGAPMQFVFATAYLNGQYAASGFSDENGNYLIEGLGTGSYKVEFDPSFSPTTGYMAEYYNNQPTAATATAIPVTNGVNTPNRNGILDRGATLTGKVTALTGTGTPLSNVMVNVYNAAGDGVKTVYTNAQGIYTAAGLPAGNYRLEYEPSPFGPAAAYLSEFYQNKLDLATATPVSLAAGATRTVNEALAKGGQITGRVIAAGTTTNLANVTVYVYDSQNAFAGFATTNASGVYTTAALRTGSYRLQFLPPSTGTASLYLGEYHLNQASLQTATAVSVNAPAVLTINADLARGSQIVGNVTAADTNAALEDVTVTIYDAANRFVTQATTNAAGAYATSGVPSGTYKVYFGPSDSGITGNYVGEFLLDKLTIETANPLVVTAPTPRRVAASLAKGSRIQGKVTALSATGAPLEDVEVTVYDLSGRPVAATSTDEMGNYSTPAVRSGSYKVEFDPHNSAETFNYALEYFNNQPTFAGATAVAVTAPTNRPGINAALERGGCIQGKVTALTATGVALDNVDVNVYDATGQLAGSTTTDETGGYGVHGLRAESYKVEFEPTQYGAARSYLREYFNNRTTYATADAVAVAANGVRTGINAALERGTQISGKVTALTATGAGLNQVSVLVYNSSTGEMVALTTTDATGVYSTPGLPTGTYKLKYEPFGPATGSGMYAGEFFTDKFTLATANPIAVTAPTARPNINVALDRGARIQGRVTAVGTNAPLSNVWVMVFDAAGGEVASTSTDAAGNYTTPALRSNTYKVGFFPAGFAAASAFEYFNNKATLAASDNVVVTAPTDRTAINAVLENGGRISGRVTAAIGGAPVANVGVTVYDSAGRIVGSAMTDANGSYTTTGLRTGAYRLGFTPSVYSGLRASFYNGKTTLATANPVSITAMPSAVNNINAVLSR